MNRKYIFSAIAILAIVVGGFFIYENWNYILKSVEKINISGISIEKVFADAGSDDPGNSCADDDYCCQLSAKISDKSGSVCGDGQYDYTADLDKDGAINSNDLGAYLSNHTAQWCQQQLSSDINPCVTPISSTLGGTVSGLRIGMTISLQNNLSDDIKVSSNGSFTFPTSLVGYQDYSVSIFSQSFGAGCTVTNWTGASSGTNITNVLVSCEPSTAGYYDYSDTLLVVNDNSPISTAIANYFLQKRPTFDPTHVVHLNLPDSETEQPWDETGDTISNNGYETKIVKPIYDFMVSNGLVDSTNYIILTKGIPIKIDGGDFSVDSVLAWCLGKDPCKANQVNPYWKSSLIFSHKKFDIYLVTRLDGYVPKNSDDSPDLSQIEALIDNASNASLNGQIELDECPGRVPYTNYVPAAADLESNGIPACSSPVTYPCVNLDQTSTFLRGQQNVIGYYSCGSWEAGEGTSEVAITGNTYVHGAIAETAVSYSGFSFYWSSPIDYGQHHQSRITDLIAGGVSGAKGYASEPYLAAMADPNILFNRYTSGYNMADSFYAASNYIGWKDVVIGDPKMVIIPPSTDATLSSLTSSSGTLSPAFNSSTISYSVVLPIGTSAVPTVSAIATDLDAATSTTQVASVTGSATVLVTAQDETTTKTYTINFSVALSGGGGGSYYTPLNTTSKLTPNLLETTTTTTANAIQPTTSTQNNSKKIEILKKLIMLLKQLISLLRSGAAAVFNSFNLVFLNALKLFGL